MAHEGINLLCNPNINGWNTKSILQCSWEAAWGLKGITTSRYACFAITTAYAEINLKRYTHMYLLYRFNPIFILILLMWSKSKGLMASVALIFWSHLMRIQQLALISLSAKMFLHIGSHHLELNSKNLNILKDQIRMTFPPIIKIYWSNGKLQSINMAAVWLCFSFRDTAKDWVFSLHSLTAQFASNAT